MPVAGDIPEKQFQASVAQLARMRRWETYHTYDSRRSNPGFPDLVLVRAPRIIFAELKTLKGKLTASQERWIAALSACPEAVEVYVWRPNDWSDGTIEQTLK